MYVVYPIEREMLPLLTSVKLQISSLANSSQMKKMPFYSKVNSISVLLVTTFVTFCFLICQVFVTKLKLSLFRYATSWHGVPSSSSPTNAWYAYNRANAPRYDAQPSTCCHSQTTDCLFSQTSQIHQKQRRAEGEEREENRTYRSRTKE